MQQLQGFVTDNPRDPFPRYALALELRSRGQLDEASQVFGELIDTFPDYTPAYLHAGGVLAGLGRKEEAAALFRKGIEATGKKGEAHAKGELETALADLTDAD